MASLRAAQGTVVGNDARARVFMRTLPEIYRGTPLLQDLMSCFEEVLLGPSTHSEQRSVQASLDAVGDVMDPAKAPPEFLPWLAGWIGLMLHGDFPENARRQLIANAVTLYQWRGTQSGIQKILEIVTGCSASVFEPEISSLRVGVEAVVGHSTRLGRDMPHFFSVAVQIPNNNQHRREQIEALARLAVDRSKPAHTFYNLTVSGEGSSATLPGISTGVVGGRTG